MKSLYTLVYCSLASLLLLAVPASAQTPDGSDEDNFQTVTTFGITTNTNAGLLGGFVFRQSKKLDGELFGKTQYRYISLEVVNVKHPREYAAGSSNFGGSFLLGKENYLFVLRPQYGRELSLFRRNTDEGISVNAIFAAGPSLAIIKPYYVEVSAGNTTRQIPYSQAVASPTAGGRSEFIVGSGGFFQGLGESSLNVGLHAKAALSFELSAFRSNTTGLEIGFLSEIFPSKIVIVPNTNTALGDRTLGNRSFFTSGYVTLFFGTKK
ncbi:hypothetical protein [Fibrivirga algicola]|uniref:Outer membrane protein beta-barrel domain-containing protein n=1 Tax=Fibrivirga algicola TaxID=2950420 RepID=A0ABX0QQY6_9BACT|nr:hypothetical protein [Fibrivirga algicola]ARK11825.1 hypothetical protein A6C57_16640 [Fibrella sp. ES10-3-2-2]NID13277.1 hypothetical protein [Fibrivirga algicola]